MVTRFTKEPSLSWLIGEMRIIISAHWWFEGIAEMILEEIHSAHT